MPAKDDGKGGPTNQRQIFLRNTDKIPLEIQKVVEFMDEYREHPNWFWFVKISRVMLISGCRISEVVKMKINELTMVR